MGAVVGDPVTFGGQTQQVLIKAPVAVLIVNDRDGIGTSRQLREEANSFRSVEPNPRRAHAFAIRKSSAFAKETAVERALGVAQGADFKSHLGLSLIHI